MKSSDKQKKKLLMPSRYGHRSAKLSNQGTDLIAESHVACMIGWISTPKKMLQGTPTGRPIIDKARSVSAEGIASSWCCAQILNFSSIAKYIFSLSFSPEEAKLAKRREKKKLLLQLVFLIALTRSAGLYVFGRGNSSFLKISSLKSAETGFSPRLYVEKMGRVPKNVDALASYSFADAGKATRYFHSY